MVDNKYIKIQYNKKKYKRSRLTGVNRGDLPILLDIICRRCQPGSFDAGQNLLSFNRGIQIMADTSSALYKLDEETISHHFLTISSSFLTIRGVPKAFSSSRTAFRFAS